MHFLAKPILRRNALSDIMQDRLGGRESGLGFASLKRDVQT